jgi:hypothetical protein
VAAFSRTLIVGEQETDLIHPSKKHVDWNESFYFNFYDRDKDICAFMRIGFKPNRNEKNMICYLLPPDGSVIGSRDVVSFTGPKLQVSGLSFKRIVPDREWRMEYSGSMRRTVGNEVERRNVTFDLTYKALNKVFDYRESVSGYTELVNKVAPAEHTEQFGTVEGILAMEGAEMHVSGLGERDHAWGTTDWISPSTWTWLSGQFSESEAFNFTKLVVGKDTVDAGFICIDGRNRPLVKVDMSTEFTKGGTPKSLKTHLMEESGESHEIEGTVIRYAKLPFAGNLASSTSLMYETLTKYRMGNSVGYGIAEYLIRA